MGMKKYGTKALPRLKQVRQEQGVSIRALAKEAGVASSTIYEIENGRRGAHHETVVKIANALGVEKALLVFPPEQVAAWKKQDERENELLEQQLAALTDEELEAILLESSLLRRRVEAIARRVWPQGMAEE